MYEIKSLKCLQCASEFPSQTLFSGCPHCHSNGKVSNVTVVYEQTGAMSPDESLSLAENSMWRYRPFLGVQSGEVSLGEGLTPLIHSTSLGDKLGLANLYLKNESQNPTASYKDRLSSTAITRAKMESAIGVATSSTGNHGAATAAYAAKAGLPCLIFTVANAPQTLKLQMQALGAMLVATEDYRDRWTLLRHCTEELGWYSTGNYANPPVGSSPYGIEGYKTIAYEICESFAWQAPDTIVMPVAYGDGFYGVYKGFLDLVERGWIPKAPRMIAVETGGSLTRAVKDGLDYAPAVSIQPSIALSIHTPVSTFQALKAIQASCGSAIVVTDPQVLEAQRWIGHTEGLFVESTSAAVVAGIKQLAEAGEIAEGEVVVGVLTSTGLKQPDVIEASYPEVPVIEPDIKALSRALKNNYGYQLST